MRRKVIIALMSLCVGFTIANAEEGKRGDRSSYIRAFEDYARKGQTEQSVECGTKATELYYKENLYHEAFELLRRIDQTISSQSRGAKRSALHYMTSRERMRMYMKLRKTASAQEQLGTMERHANASGDENVRNDLLYNKTVFYYSTGKTALGDATFREMADRLTAKKEYGKVDEVYRTLIDNGRRSGSANLVAQSYGSYMAWKDSVSAIRKADEIGALKRQIADNEAAIAGRDASLATRKATIIGLGILAAALATALALGGIILLRFIALTRKQKKTIRLANENIALKAKFISNISAQLDPTLKKLDSRQPEVKALTDFSDHIQALSALEGSAGKEVEVEETQIQPLCESLAEGIRGKVRQGVTVKVDAPKLSAPINKEYVSHILSHLLNNAAEFTPEGGNIWLDFKKRGPHSHQFIVSNNGETIAEERREDVFKPFLEIRDLTKGDGLGLPICRQMAVNMKGDLSIDPAFTKGTRFVLNLHV